MNKLKVMKLFTTLLSIILIIALLACKDSKMLQNNMSIYPIDPYEETDTFSNNRIQKTKYFIVENVDTNNKDILKIIKKFAEKNTEGNLERFSNYTMVFYKSSESLNRNFKQTKDDLLFWHGKNLLYSFQWIEGKLGFCTIHKEGKIDKIIGADKL